MKRQRFVNLLDRLSEIDKYSLVCRKFYKTANKLPTDNDAYDEECLKKEERTWQVLDQIRNKNTKTK